MSPPRIKICGITRVEDAVAALQLGVDAVGLVFYKKSPRSIELKQASDIASAVGPFVTVTALFVNPQAQEVERVLEQVPVSLLQFHGEEQAEFCRQFSRPWMKALRIQSSTNVLDMVKEYQTADALLFDTYQAGIAGGTGECFDWNLVARKNLPHGFNKPVVLAGGLNAGNIKKAIEVVEPYGVDVSGGVESVVGIKDRSKIQSFIQAVRLK